MVPFSFLIFAPPKKSNFPTRQSRLNTLKKKGAIPSQSRKTKNKRPHVPKTTKFCSGFHHKSFLKNLAFPKVSKIHVVLLTKCHVVTLKLDDFFVQESVKGVSWALKILENAVILNYTQKCLTSFIQPSNHASVHSFENTLCTLRLNLCTQQVNGFILHLILYALRSKIFALCTIDHLRATTNVYALWMKFREKLLIFKNGGSDSFCQNQSWKWVLQERSWTLWSLPLRRLPLPRFTNLFIHMQYFFCKITKLLFSKNGDHNLKLL